MKILMKKNRIFLLFLVLLPVFVISYGCVEAVSNPPGETEVLNIAYPITGDTVYVGKNDVLLETHNASIGLYEIFVEGHSVGTFVSDSSLYFTVTEDAIGSTIEYYINGYKDGGGISQSKVQKVYVTGVPRAPSDLILSTFNEHEVLLRWKDNSNNENMYELWRSVGDNESYGGEPYKVFNENTTNYRDIGLDSYTAYYYKVRAKNQYGYSKFSNEVSSNGESGRDAPTDLRAEALGATVVRLTWKDNSVSENAFLVKRTTIDNNGDYTNWVDAATVPPNTIEYFDEGLQPNTVYAYQVFAVLPSSMPSSNITTVRTSSSSIQPPTNLLAQFDMDARKVKLTWNDNSNMEFGTQIQRKIYGSENLFESIASTGPDETVFYDSNYTPGFTYVYRVRYLSGNGSYSMFSNEDTAYVPILPPKNPSNLTISELSPGTAFLLSWNDNSTDEDGFEIWQATATHDFTLFKTLSANTTNYTVAGLNRDTVYYFKVRAFKNTLYSGFTNEARTPLIAPTNLQAVADPTPRVILTWLDNSHNEGWFEIERRFTGGGQFERVGVVAPNVTTFNDEGVYRGTTYDYRVRAASEESVSDWTDIITVQIPSKKK